ncbi:MAG TPA: hypothetical protein PLT66_04350 [Bacillota bacterium]|nr:hypothetical protein [Bacillota bacterium]
MKKRVIAFLFFFILVFPLLASCDNEAELVDVAPSVYTVYAITGESTTAEAKKQVELELNRYLLQECDMAIKLYLFTEDEYDQAIKDAWQMMADQDAEASAAISLSKAQAKLSGASKSKNDSSSIEGTVSVQTEDVILDILEAGGEIETKNGKKRFDIFLCCGNKDYYEYINGEDGIMLQKLDSVLTSEAKVLLDYIYPSFVNPTSSAISAARVGGATYGIPNNGPIGEYEYLLFDTEYLSKYEYDALSMRSLQDLEEYLAVIKQNETDVIPLYNVYAPNDVSYLYQDGYPVACDKDGYLFGPYLDEEGVENSVKEYFRLINNYNKLGYIGPDGYSDDADFAVRFLSGNTSDIEALSAKTGKKYDYIVYKTPVATAENTLEYTFCISKYCAASDVAEAIQFLVLLNTNESFRNIFLYGCEDIHYVRNRDGRVEKLTDDYSMSIEQTGNQYLAWLEEGEDENKWEYCKEQNLDSTISPFISFIYQRQELKEDDPDESADESNEADESIDDGEESVDNAPVVSEAPDEDEPEIKYEPDYQTIFTDIINKYWDKLISGKGDFDTTWNALQAELVEAGYATALRDSFLPQLKTVYKSYPIGTSPYSYMSAKASEESTESK